MNSIRRRVGRNQIADLTQNPKLGAAGAVDLFFVITAGGKGRRKGLEPGLSVPRWLRVN